MSHGVLGVECWRRDVTGSSGFCVKVGANYAISRYTILVLHIIYEVTYISATIVPLHIDYIALNLHTIWFSRVVPEYLQAMSIMIPINRSTRVNPV